MIMLCRVQYLLFSVKKPGVRMLYCLVRARVNLIQANSRFVRSWRVLTQKSNANLNYFTYDRSPLLNGLWFVMIMIMISPSSLSTHCIEQEFISLRSGIVPLTAPTLTPHPSPPTPHFRTRHAASGDFFIFLCYCLRAIQGDCVPSWLSKGIVSPYHLGAGSRFLSPWRRRG